MALVRRRELPLTEGEFRLRVWAAVFTVSFVIMMIVAMING